MYTAAVETTPERLIESTRELLWERGYVGTSPKAIQQRSGVGQGSMYHHFSGKPELALAAVRRTAERMRAAAERELSLPGTAVERVSRYLRRERDVLRGCPIGRLTQDPEVVVNPRLRAPLDETFEWLRGRLADVLAEGQARGEIAPGLDTDDIAAALVAVLQGGYVLARASGSAAPFDQAVSGALSLLAQRA
ncbi:TetR/AcrR family transcriptional regulator [Streptomyces sp. ME01-24h]|nr:TetR/AcrR family transcriptional regulator [Streptomyces sp. ME19-03-3]MDX3355255.1 TetR/AcrR family transcriptional regulator [Streptomyces sp. ME01-24h]